MRLGQFRPVTCGESMELCLFSILFNEEGSQRAFRCRAVVDGKELAWAEGVCMADVYHLWQRPNNLTSKNHARTSTAVAEFRQNGSTRDWRPLFALSNAFVPNRDHQRPPANSKGHKRGTICILANAWMYDCINGHACTSTCASISPSLTASFDRCLDHPNEP